MYDPGKKFAMSNVTKEKLPVTALKTPSVDPFATVHKSVLLPATTAHVYAMLLEHSGGSAVKELRVKDKLGEEPV